MGEEDFDPYFKWLGVPVEEQPPNHYRLLGIPLFVSDTDVISNGADRQMMLLRTFQTSPNALHSQRLLNELTTARLCLLNVAKKAAYDQQLRAKMAKSAPEPVAPPPAAIPFVVPTLTQPAATVSPAPTMFAQTAVRPLAKRRPQSLAPIVAVVCAAVVLIPIVFLAASLRRQEQSDDQALQARNEQSKARDKRLVAPAAKEKEEEPQPAEIPRPEVAVVKNDPPPQQVVAEEKAPVVPAAPPVVTPPQPSVAPKPSASRMQSFDQDPRWSAHANNDEGNAFGFRDSDHTGGNSPAGEAGGILTRSTEVAWYADANLRGLLTLDQPLRASGEFTPTEIGKHFNNGIFIGHFSTDAASHENNRTNFVGITFAEPHGKGFRLQAQMEFADGSMLQGNEVNQIKVSEPYTWNYVYDPTIGDGQLRAEFFHHGDSVGVSTIDLSPEFRAIRAKVNAFGLSTGGLGEGSATNQAALMIDNVTYTIAPQP